MDEEGSFISEHWPQLLLGVAAVAAILVALYFTVYQPVRCDTFACYQDKMQSCDKATYVNEEPEASWRYDIIGKDSGECRIKVTMLQAKQGDLGLEDLAGFDMECRYPLGIRTYPEKDLGACSGKLKEELQSIVIKKLYTYILDNLGALDESLKQAI